MCVVIISSELTASEDMEVYKLVRKCPHLTSVFYSQYRPMERIPQKDGDSCFGNYGSLKEYVLGTSTFSPFGFSPGIYTYKTRSDAGAANYIFIDDSQFTILKCIIPKGTLYKEAKDGGLLDCILAECVRPIEVVS